LVAIDEARDGGADMQGLIRAVIAEFRHLLVARVNPELLEKELAPEDVATVRERAAGTTQARLVRALRLFGDALGSVRASGNARLELETAMLRFIIQVEDPTLEALAARIAALEGGDSAPPVVRAAPAPRPSSARPQGGSAPTPAPRATVADPTPSRSAPVPAPRPRPEPEPTPVAPSGPLTVEKLRSLWPNIRSRAESQRPSLAASLSRAAVAEVSGDAVVLRLPDAIAVESLKRGVDVVKSAIEAVVARPIDLRLVVAPLNGEPKEDAEASGDDLDDVARYADQRLL
jgi:DNA polymerase III gamma/tau subunit